jgi:hypothetical protein
MTMLTEGKTTTGLASNLLSNKINSSDTFPTLPLTYFDLLDETPEYSEAAILLEDGTIEYCYIKIGLDSGQYFGFNYASPNTAEHSEISSRHKFDKELEANTFERYPSGKTILSRGGRVLEISLPQKEKSHV